MSRSSDDLKDVVAALPAAQLPHLLDLMCIQPGGNATVRRQRILTAISGRPARQRSGWLDFFITALEAYGRYHGGFENFSVVDIDFSELDDEEFWDDVHTGILDSYLDHLRDVNDQPLPKFLPFDLLSDLEYDSADDPVRFRNFTGTWPDAATLQRLVGRPQDAAAAGSNSSDAERIEQLESEMAEWKDQLENMPQAVKDSLRDDISENKFGVSGEHSVAIMRKTLAYKVDTECFFLFDYEVGAGGERKIICDAGSPLTKDMLASLFFDRQMSSNDSKKIERRNLCDDKVFISARVLSEPKKQALGDPQSKIYKDFEMLRIRQQTMVKNSQCLLKTINFASRALQPLGVLLEQNDDAGDAMDLPVHVASELQKVQGFLYSCLHACSDSLHLVGMDCSELERQRNDLYLAGSTGNSSMRVQRPNSDPVRMEMDTTALDKIAGDELRRQKELAAGSRTRSPGPAPRTQRPTSPGPARPNTAERSARAAQSARDKAAAAARKSAGGSPTAAGPAPAPAPGPSPSAKGKNAKKKK